MNNIQQYTMLISEVTFSLAQNIGVETSDSLYFIRISQQAFNFIIYKLMKYRKIILKYNAYFQKVIFSQVKYKNLYNSLWVKLYAIKCKICFSSSINFAYNKKKIQIFGVIITFISMNEVRKCIFHLWLHHLWNIHFFTSFDEIKVIFTPKIQIAFIYGLSLAVEINTKISLVEFWHHVITWH